MAGKTAPFSRFEWMIAWRYMRAKRETGGVSIMTWISLIGVTLAVFALIAVLAVRSGFRADFVDTIVGANAHLTVRQNYMETVTVTQGDQSVDVTRRVETINNGDYMCKSTLMAILGREVCYTGREMTWEQIAGSQQDLRPAKYEWGDGPEVKTPQPGKYTHA